MSSVCLSVCVYVYMYIRINVMYICAPESNEGFCSYSSWKSLYVLHRCPIDLKIPAAKIYTIQMGFKTQNDDFLENSSNEYD
jgi:hypothetical protein